MCKLISIVFGLFVLAGSAAEKPNILFILTDDQRFDNLSCYGNKIFQTPNIDRLASQGTRFTNMFVTTSICASSRATIFSGLVETTHGYTFGKKPLSEKIMTNSYPALMKSNGYKTGFAGKFGVNLVNKKNKINEMFDVYKPINRNPYHKKMPDGSTRHETELIGDEACKMMEQFKGNPFCISVSFFLHCL